MTDEEQNYIEYPSATSKGYMEAEEGDGLVMNRPTKARGTVQKDTAPTLTTGDGCGTGVVVREPNPEVAGEMSDINFKSDIPVYSEEGISPALRTATPPKIEESSDDVVQWPSLNGPQTIKEGDGVIPSRPYSARKTVMEDTSFAVAATAVPGVAVKEPEIKVAGKMTDTDFGQDQQVFAEDSLSPTLRAEAHGHQPLIEVQDEVMMYPQANGMVPVHEGDGVMPSRPYCARKTVMNGASFAIIASGTTGGVCVRDKSELQPIAISEMVRVRVHDVDMKGLYEFLKTAKDEMGVTVSDIAKALDLPKTTVEHWFRNDESQSIPDEDVWFKLKEYLKIEDDIFDAQVTEFEEKESTYEMSERAYHEDGVAPTLKAGSPEKIALNPNEKLPDLKEGEVAAMHTPGKEVKRQNGPRFSTNGAAFTMTASDVDGIAQRKEGRLRIRYLTPLECWRLQAFPDEAYYKAVEAGMSKSAAYKQAGNSITTTVLQSIFEDAFIKKKWKKTVSLSDWGF